MNPASKLIKQFRCSRSFSQKEASQLLGYEQSFLCAVEGGNKDVPKKQFVEQMIRKYHLTQEEQGQLYDALKRSNRKLIIPTKSPETLYELVYRLNSQVKTLNEKQMKLIDFALELEG